MKIFLLSFILIVIFGVTNFISFNFGGLLSKWNFQKEAVKAGFAGYSIESEFGWKSIQQVVMEFLIKNQQVEPPKIEESAPQPKDFAL